MSWCIQDKGCSIKIFDLVGEVHTKQAKWIELESVTGKRVVFYVPSDEQPWKSRLRTEEIIIWMYKNEYEEKPEHLPFWDGKSHLNQML